MAAKQQAKARGGQQRTQGGGMRWIMMLAVTAAVPFSLPTILLLFVGLLPTLVAALVDRGPNRYAWLCVGGLNLSGVAPFLFGLWFSGHSMSAALDILFDVFPLIVMYGSAAIGWLLYRAMPPVVGALLALRAQRRVTVLRNEQRRLVEAWGEDVAEEEVG
ncbi:acyl-CoA synthetase [Telmatospirillum sp. J64-1]|uniref:acyl-CoA synthetase n=1 Tax=Telmatospirillum sp. J64-1 TaxID=2502183 RepID=UPI00115F051D|nr:acyl-CoA synthetase [Telmatospirillum sp. J64-1]